MNVGNRFGRCPIDDDLERDCYDDDYYMDFEYYEEFYNEKEYGSCSTPLLIVAICIIIAIFVL